MLIKNESVRYLRGMDSYFFDKIADSSTIMMSRLSITPFVENHWALNKSL